MRPRRGEKAEPPLQSGSSVAAEEARDRDQVALGTAALRVCLIPLLVVGHQASESQDHPVAFWVLVALATAYALGLLALRLAFFRKPAMPLPARLDRVEAAIDFGLLCGLTYSSGGAFSELSKGFFVLPVMAAMRLRPRLTAAWAVLAIVGFVSAAYLHEETSGPQPPHAAAEETVTEALYLAWVGLGAILLSHVLGRRRERVQRLAAERGRLAAQMLAVEERERGRLAEVLHDEAVQNLLVARQEVAEAENGDREALGRVKHALTVTVDQLRGEIRAMHPTVLGQAGLEGGIDSLVEEHLRRGGPPVTVHVEPQVTGRDDQFLHALTRELLVNTAKHSHATRVEVRVYDAGGRTVLEVEDNGCGIAPGAPERVLRDGHIGLASWGERVTAVGGTLTVESEPGSGTLIRATLPSPLE